MTARAALARLHAKGWTDVQIGRALGRNHGQFIQIARGQKPGRTLAPALSTLAARRHVPAAGEAVKPLTGRHAPPARRSPGVELPTGTQRAAVGRGRTRRAVYRLQPAGGVTDGDALRLLESLRGKQAAVTVEALFLLTTKDLEAGEIEQEYLTEIVHLYQRGWDADKIAAAIREAGLRAFVAREAFAKGYVAQTARLIRITWIVVEHVLRGTRGLARAA